MKEVSFEQVRGQTLMRLSLKALWDTSYSPSKPVLVGKLYMKWDQKFLNYGQNSELRLCIGYQKATNWGEKRDWIAFYGMTGDGEFSDLRAPLEKNTFLGGDGGRDFCGSNRYNPAFDQDPAMTEDMAERLTYDIVPAEGSLGFADLGVSPRKIESDLLFMQHHKFSCNTCQ